MAKRTIESEVKLSGEQEYKRALSEINNGLGVLNSEMKKTSAQFQDNANSTEALTHKGEVLEKQLLSQRDKVEVLRKALQESAEQYGEADARTMRWQRQLNEAETAVANTEAAIRRNNEALDETNEKGGFVSGMLTQLTEKFGDQLPQGAKAALQGIAGFSDGAIVAISAVIAAAKALIDIEKQMISQTTESAASADDILTESIKTGMSTDKIQELRYSAELLDVSYETIAGSMTKLVTAMAKARDGNEEVQEAFWKLNVIIRDADGNLRSAEDVFYDVVDGLAEIENATDRDAIAMQLFGKSAQDLNPLVAAGTDRMKELAAEAHNVGYVMSEEQLEALGRVDDAYQRLLKTQEAMQNQTSAEFAPAMENTYSKWQEWISNVGNTFKESGIVKDLGSILDSTMGLLDPLVELGREILPILEIPLRAIAGVLGLIADAVNAVWGFFQGLTGGGWDRFATALGFGDQPNYTSRALFGYNAAGDLNYRGGATWVGENGPELVTLPQGSSIQTNQESRRAGGNVFNITIDAKSVREFNDIIRIATEAPMLERMG